MARDLTENEIKALKAIRNAMAHGGGSPSIREVAHELGFRSPRSAMLLLNKLIDNGWLRRRNDNSLQILQDLREKKTALKPLK